MEKKNVDWNYVTLLKVTKKALRSLQHLQKDTST